MFVTYRPTLREIVTNTVDVYYHSKVCYGVPGSREGRRFYCKNDRDGLTYDKADRNVSVNIACCKKAKLDGHHTRYSDSLYLTAVVVDVSVRVGGCNPPNLFPFPHGTRSTNPELRQLEKLRATHWRPFTLRIDTLVIVSLPYQFTYFISNYIER